MSHQDLVRLGDIAVAFVLSFLIGFEREVRGATAGDRTFALVGTASAGITAVTAVVAPHAVGGIVAGIGFIGGGVLFRAEGTLLGLTTAASIWAVAAVGIVAGMGHPLLAVCLSVIVLIDLEIRHIPALRYLDARRYHDRARDDSAPPHP